MGLLFINTVNSFIIPIRPEHQFSKNTSNCGGQPDNTIVVSNFKCTAAVPLCLSLTTDAYPTLSHKGSHNQVQNLVPML
jgi:hypothetical protein